MPYSTYAAAGKNKIINGDFGVWQRGTTFTNPGTGSYTADRYRTSATGGDPTSRTISQQTFTPGTAPVAGYESQFFLRSVLTTLGSSTGIRIQNMIEDVRTLAGQTVTLSFWAKSDTTRTQPAPGITQNFGSGGSSTVDFTASTYTTTTAWQRFSFTLTMPSISGKTIGTNSHIRVSLEQNITDGNTMDIWGVQLEAGSNVTAFQTATGNPASELAACQRYYYRLTSTDDIYSRFAMGSATATTAAQFLFNFPVQMRVKPSSLDLSATSTFLLWDGANNNNVTTNFGMSRQSLNNASVDFGTASTMTQYRPYWVLSQNTTTAFIGFNAEF
jgi:hypothetical protein